MGFLPLRQCMFFILLTPLFSFAIDNVHFYRANRFWGEPRFERSKLTSINSSTAWTDPRTGQNGDGQTVNVLNIYGFYNMKDLGTNVPELSPANPLHAILIDLSALPDNGTFGHLSFTGDFRLFEAVSDIYVNLWNGFFIQWYLPLRKLGFSNVRFTDLSPDSGPMPNANTPVWKKFLSNFDPILDEFGLQLKPDSRVGFGDLSILGGWACNYQDTEYLDFIDVNGKIGGLFPTGKRINRSNIFQLPTGYNGHFGVPIKFDLSIGAWEWLTLGFHIGALFLLERKEDLRIKTDTDQSGLIKLAQARVDVDPGTLLDLQLMTKADHLFRGLSLIIAYSYNHQKQTGLELEQNSGLNQKIINTDRQFDSWSMQVLNLVVEYDFVEKPSDIGPRIGFAFNHVITGKRIFRGSLKDFTLGFDIAWQF